MPRPTSPCKGCSRRAVGCHDLNTCAAWAAFRQTSDAMHSDARRQYLAEKDVLELQIAGIIRTKRQLKMR